MKRYIALALAIICISTSCRKKAEPEKPPVTDTPTALKIEVQNMVGNLPLAFNTAYTNAHGDTFRLTVYRYFISNIRLLGEGGAEFAEQESYYLVDQKIDSSRKFTVKNVPAGTYTGMKFLIGVDSTRNTTGVQTGALDPTSGMFWSWNTGYIMSQMEGTSPQSQYGDIYFHQGGFRGRHHVLRWVTLNFPTAVTVSKSQTPVIHIISDVAEWFKTPYTIDFSRFSTVADEGAEAAQIADNYADMFKVDHID